MQAARILGQRPHVLRIVLFQRAAGAGNAEGPVVRVLDPARGGIFLRDGFTDRMQALPFGGGIAAVDRALPVETGIAFGQEVAVEVGDIAVCIGVHRVVGRIGAQLHRLVEVLVAACLGARIRLREGLERLLHQLDRDPLAVLGAHDGAVVAAIGSDRARGHAGGGLVGQRNVLGLHLALAVTVFVEHLAIALDHGLEVFVDDVAPAGGVHPPGALVEALVDEELSPGDRAVGIEALFAGHVDFGPEVERGMRVNEQQRPARLAQFGRDGKAVRAAWFGVKAVVGNGQLRRLAVEGFEILEVDFLDVATDTAFAERQRHPGLEASDQFGFDLRMGQQVVIETIGKAVHQLFEPCGTGRVLRLHVRRGDVHLHAQVAPDLGLAFDFGQPAHRIDVIEFDAVEIVLRLGVHQPEDGVGIGLAEYVGDAPFIAHDGHALGLPGQARGLARGDGGRAFLRLYRWQCGAKHGAPNQQRYERAACDHFHPR